MSKHNYPQNQPRNNQTVVVHHEQQVQSFSGPLPHPEILRQFEQVSPGAAERIIKMAEDQSQHRRDLEKKVIESDVARSKMGQVLGFVIAIFGLTVSAIIAIYGNAIAGTILGAGTIASLVGVFMYGTNSRKAEREEKQDQE
jgi:uncharacterized membrane protein